MASLDEILSQTFLNINKMDLLNIGFLFFIVKNFILGLLGDGV